MADSRKSLAPWEGPWTPSIPYPNYYSHVINEEWIYNTLSRKMVPARPQICPLLNLPERVHNLIVSYTHTIGIVSLSLTCKALLARGLDVSLSMTHIKRIRLLQTIKVQEPTSGINNCVSDKWQVCRGCDKLRPTDPAYWARHKKYWEWHRRSWERKKLPVPRWHDERYETWIDRFGKGDMMLCPLHATEYFYGYAEDGVEVALGRFKLTREYLEEQDDEDEVEDDIHSEDLEEYDPSWNRPKITLGQDDPYDAGYSRPAYLGHGNYDCDNRRWEDFGEEFWEAYDGEDEEGEDVDEAQSESQSEGQDKETYPLSFEFKWPIDYW